ncbi:hypothetical protein BAE44_0010149 [Dichanthelium oligosanthes]|uniref:Protein SPEAR3 n=1 Tax=Dichanthelium oligosanthes TaxID=888268 RepID=A0A1E5VUR0_9POAL|nr:hypothetical protein BAE44_0010149 [Dichanthelium oligosanthes]
MSASNSGSGDSMEWGRGRSSGSRKGKRGGNSSSDKPRQPQRGLGVAQLEKIRIQSEMAEYSLHHPLGQQPPIHRTGSFNLEEPRLSHSLPSSPSSPFHANIGVSSSYPIHRPNLAMAYGERSGDIRYGASQTNPNIRSPNYYHGAIYGSEAHYTHPSNVTLPLFQPEESICLNRPYDLNHTVDSSNLDDEEVDLELKL